MIDQLVAKLAGDGLLQGLDLLVDAAAGAARMAGADVMFLEVAHDNLPALGLYEAAGFARAGLRRGYYDRGAAGSADAVVMRLDLGRAA